MKAGTKELCTVLCSVLCLTAMLCSYTAFAKSDQVLYIPAVVFWMLGAGFGIAMLSRI